MQNTPPLLRHVVVFRFKPSATDAQVNNIVRAFAQLPSQIDSIHAFEHGPNVSAEGLDQRFNYCFMLTFKDQAGLDEYLPHPAHKDFVQKLLPLLDDAGAFVVDYHAQ